MDKDIEAARGIDNHLINATVRTFSWQDVGVTVKDRKTKEPLSILTAAYGFAEQGQVLALMGPSGSGKTTLLNVLANRMAAANAQVSGRVLVNQQQVSQATRRRISSYIEQEDSLIGSLTARETIDFSARLSLPSTISKRERLTRINNLLVSFGLSDQADSLVGTPIRKGMSGGQKRRLGIASQLVTSPNILFLDEPTSGLDSTASYEVMRFIKDIAQINRLIVIASIHQPSTTTFELFDTVMLLSGGKTCYFGPIAATRPYFAAVGYTMPLYMNPAEYLLDLINGDFATDKMTSAQQLVRIQTAWMASEELMGLKSKASSNDSANEETSITSVYEGRDKLSQAMVLLHRNFIKSYRDVTAYGIRIAMHTGLAIMMGTVWLRLSHHQSSIQPFINAIFFGGAFMSFMAVAYIPAIIEDLHMFRKERANGLYGPAPFMLANFLIGIPYLFLISVLFSLIAYWLSSFAGGADAFFTWVMWLFLDLLAAEALVVLITSIAPIFVVALAVTAFANGLWMCVGGFLVPLGTLNVFWKYVFHYIDYQAYVFQGMMVNQFKNTVYSCDVATSVSSGSTEYNCIYPSDLQSQGQIRGTAVLNAYQYSTGKVGEWVGIMVATIAVYRLLGYLTLSVRKR